MAFRRLGTKELIDQVARKLESGNFTQTPQHEGKNIPSPIFGKSSTIDISTIKTMPPEINLSAENQKLLIEAYMKLLDTIGKTQEVEIDSQRDIIGNRYLIYVHGISKHTARYSNKWWKALQPHVGQVFGDGNLGNNRKEVIWSHLVNRREVNSVDEEKKEQLRREIEDILEDRQRQEIAINSGGKKNIHWNNTPAIPWG